LSRDGPSDEALLESFLGGHEPAFAELMRRHEDRIFALALGMTGNRADALDATQEAFITVFRRAESFRGESAIGTWIYRIGINACHDLIRRRKPWAQWDPSESHPPATRGVEDAVAARLDVAQALDSLPDHYKVAVTLHDLGGVPYDEIARLTDVGIGTVKSRISRGRRALAAYLEQGAQPGTSKKQWK
jgi:RNA polymerase sigma-70 factor, ECF subfamily